MKYRLLLVFSIYLFVTNVRAQNTAPVWSSYNQGTGENSDAFNSIIPAELGNLIAVGYTYRSGNYKDFLIVKYNSNGDTLWTRTKNGKGSGDDEAIAAAVDGSGNVYVTGFVDDGTQNDNIYTIKFASDGTNIWDTAWSSLSLLDDQPIGIAIDPSGNIIVGGNTEPDSVSGSTDYVTLKYSPAGALLWEQIFSRSGVPNDRDEMAALALDQAGDVYVTGRSSNGTNDDYATLKYSNANGSVLWFQIYNGGGTDRATDLICDQSNNVIVTGRSDNGSNDDFRTIKYNSAGVLQWTRSYNGTSNQNDRATAITVDGSDNVFVTGQSDVDASTLTNYDFATVKYNAAGTIQWSRVAGNTANQYDIPSAIVVDGNGNVIVTGTADRDASTFTSDDVMTILINGSGALQWNKTYAGTLSGSDKGAAVIIDINGNAIVGGMLLNLNTQADASLISYAVSGNENWIKNYNGEGDYDESVQKVLVDGAGNSFAIGYTMNQNENRNAIIEKVNASGSIIADYRFSTIDDDEFSCGTLDANGNVIAGGYTKVSGEKSNFLLVKWDPSTSLLVWTKVIDFNTESDKLIDLTTDANGNIYVTGRSDQNPLDSVENLDIVTMKFNAAGTELWRQIFNGTGNLRDEPVRILLDNAGNVVVCGRSENIHDDDFIVLKYDGNSGIPLWSNPGIYNGPFSNDDRALDMTIDSQNNIYVAGFSQVGSGAATEDAAVVVFNPSGVQSNFYGFDGAGNGDDRAVKIAHDNSDHIIFTINSDIDPDPTISNFDILTFKVDQALTPIWNSPSVYSSPINKDDEANDLLITSTGEIIIGGSTEADSSNGTINRNLLVVRYDANGNTTLTGNFDGPASGDDQANSIAVNGNLLWAGGYVTGAGQNGKDIVVNQYDLLTAISSLDKSEYSVVYPNPCTSVSQLKMADQSSRKLNVQITDVIGKVVMEKEMENGTTVIDRNNFAAGVFFYRVIKEGKVVSKGKIIFE